MSIFDKFDNLPNDYIPCNVEEPCYCYNENTIVRGTTSRQSFVLPYDLVKQQGLENGEVEHIRITYKESLTTILEKTENDIKWVDNADDETSIVYFDLSQEETYLFTPTTPSLKCEVQIKVVLSSGETLVSPIDTSLKVLDVLNQEVIGEKEDGE